MDQQKLTPQSKGDPGDLASQEECHDLPKLRPPATKEATEPYTHTEQVLEEGIEGLLDGEVPRAAHGDERGSIESLISKARIRRRKKQAPA